MDYFEQHKKQVELSEGLFENLFSKNKPEEQENSLFQANINGGFTFGDKSTAKEVNTPAAIPFLKKFDWANSKLNFLFLPGTEFHADYIEFDLKGQYIKVFQGKWISGPFFGKNFKGIFRGSSFQGDFVGRYTDYESHPTTFIDGRFVDTTNSGLLGMPNTLSLNKAKNRKFNLITIPAGHYLQFRSVNGVSCYVKIIKRLDEVNSNFVFEILDGYKSSAPKTISLPWNHFRQNWKSLEINPQNIRSVAGLIEIPEGDSVKEVYVSAAPATFETPSTNTPEVNPNTFEAGKKYKFNLSLLPYLNIHTFKGHDGKFKKSEALLTFDSPEELAQFNQVIAYIKTGVLKQDIKNISKAIKYGEVDGYGIYNYLSFIFNNKSGKNVFNLTGKPVKKKIAEVNFVPPTVEKTYSSTRPYNSPPNTSIKTNEFGTAASMQRLNDFVKYFVENIIDDKGAPNKTVQDLIISRLKGVLGTNELPVAKPAQNGPGMSSDDINSLTMKESIRKQVRDIMGDNL